MLCNLHIENIAIIENASVDFVNGLNVLSGETGAGKSIIIDAINAVLGEKTSRELIRTGSNTAFVSALFSDVSSEVNELLTSLSIPVESDGTVLVQRKLYRDGKNLCHVNGMTVTVSTLKRIGLLLINIHGQRDSQDLLNPELHFSFVDNFGSLDNEVATYHNSFESWTHSVSMLRKVESEEADKERMIDLLQYQIRELEAADIKIGEREQLTEKKKLIRNLDKLNKALNAAYTVLDSACESTSSASKYIIAASSVSPAVGVLDNSLQEALSILEDCREETRDVLSQLDGADDDLDSIEERLDLLYRFSKKYGKTEEDMLAFLDSCKSQMDALENASQAIAYWRNKSEEDRNVLQQAGLILSEKRQAAALILQKRIEDELHFLDMPSAVFSVHFTPSQPTVNGFETIEFYISANPGEEEKPLAKVASGGELSRVMLAIKNALADKDSVGTLIFDEIDTGVSGRAADKISLKLKQAASIRQVLCITHLSQIASRADSHFLVEKSVRDDKTYTAVVPLDFNGRVHELARMNGGVSLTQVQFDAAKQLLTDAGIEP